MITVLENDRIKLTVCSEKGATASMVNKLTGQEHMWQLDTRYADTILPITFPHCGKFINDEYQFEGKTYPMPQHGFLKLNDMSFVEADGAHVIYRFESNEETRAMYPFDFRFDLIHTLLEDHVELTYQVTNTGGHDMYYSVGSHESYSSPIDPACDPDDSYLEFEREETVDYYVLKDEMIDGEKKLFLNGSKEKSLVGLFEGGAVVLDLKELKSRAVTIRNRKSPYGTKVEFPDAKNLVLWAPKGKVPFVCIEPWQGFFQLAGHNGDLKTKKDMICLAPGETHTMTQRFYLI